MSESKDGKLEKKYNLEDERVDRVLSTAFYGALKSKNEIYFQMASLFKAVTRDEKKMKAQLMEQILTENPSDMSGKYFMDNI